MIKIRQAIRSIPRFMLAKVWENTKFRLEYLLAVHDCFLGKQKFWSLAVY